MGSGDPRISVVPRLSWQPNDVDSRERSSSRLYAVSDFRLLTGFGISRLREISPPWTLDPREEQCYARFRAGRCKMPPAGIVLGPPTPEPESWILPGDIPLEPYRDTLDDIAFGLEFKFMIPLLTDGVDDPCPDDRRSANWTSAVGQDGLPRKPESIQREAFLAVAKAIGDIPGQRAISITDIEANGSAETDYWKDHWIVKQSNSAEPGESMKLKGYNWFAVEISSPKLEATSSTSFSTVRCVVDVLRSTYRIATNYSCELHVHLGRVDGQPFRLRTLKKLGTLCWMVEPILRSVKDPKSPNFEHVFTWASPLREYSRLASRQHGTDFSDTCMEFSPGFRANHRRALDLIWNARDPCALGQLLSGESRQYRRLGFNFSAFGGEDERAKRSPRSVEVRFLEGCGAGDKSLEEVIGWIKICVALAKVAVDEADDGFQDLIYDLIADEAQDENGHIRDSDRAARFAALLEKLRVEAGVISVFVDMVESIWGTTH